MARHRVNNLRVAVSTHISVCVEMGRHRVREVGCLPISWKRLILACGDEIAQKWAKLVSVGVGGRRGIEWGEPQLRLVVK